MGLALSASSMGTLVYGTLHTNNAPKTIDRVIDVFPTDQQSQIRTMLGESLRGIVAQQLLKKVGGGRIAVNEILVGSSGVANMIREGKIDRIMSVIQAGRGEGMQAMDDELEKKVNEGIVTGEDAYMKSIDKKRFEQ
jgi:twitching motility protein PilT